MTDQPRFESALDRQIREAAERGAFDGLPGKGEPLPGAGEPASEDWWLRGYLRREGISSELLLPPSVQLRKELDRLPATLRALRTEREVRDAVDELNRRVVEHLRFPSGPRVAVQRVDADDAVARWRADRAGPAAQPPAAQPSVGAADEPPPARRARWWRRRRVSPAPPPSPG